MCARTPMLSVEQGNADVATPTPLGMTYVVSDLTRHFIG